MKHYLIRFITGCILCWSSPILAQDFNYDRYSATTLQAIADEWNKTTESYEPGISILTPSLSIRIDASALGASTSCSNETLGLILKVSGLQQALREVGINRCLSIAATPNSTPITVYIQDRLTTDYDQEVRAGSSVRLYALLLAYQVSEDRKMNAPILLVNAFRAL